MEALYLASIVQCCFVTDRGRGPGALHTREGSRGYPDTVCAELQDPSRHVGCAAHNHLLPTELSAGRPVAGYFAPLSPRKKDSFRPATVCVYGSSLATAEMLGIWSEPHRRAKSFVSRLTGNRSISGSRISATSLSGLAIHSPTFKVITSPGCTVERKVAKRRAKDEVAANPVKPRVSEEAKLLGGPASRTRDIKSQEKKGRFGAYLRGVMRLDVQLIVNLFHRVCRAEIVFIAGDCTCTLQECHGLSTAVELWKANRSP